MWQICFKSTNLVQKHNDDIRRVTTKYKHILTAFVEAFNKVLTEQLFNTMDSQELRDPEKLSEIWVKNLTIMNKMIDT